MLNVKALGKGKISVDRIKKEIVSLESDKQLLLVQLDEIQRKINDESVSGYNSELVRNALNDYCLAFSNLDKKNQALALQCILNDVIIYPEKIVLDIFELPEFGFSSQNRIKKLPQLDEICNFLLVTNLGDGLRELERYTSLI